MPTVTILKTFLLNIDSSCINSVNAGPIVKAPNSQTSIINITTKCIFGT